MTASAGAIPDLTIGAAPSGLLRRKILTGLAWAALAAALLVAEIGGAEDTPAARAARDTWWLAGIFVSVLLDLAALYVALRLARLFPIGPPQRWRHLGPHALTALAYAIANYASHATLGVASASTADPLLPYLFRYILAFTVWDGIAHAVEYLRRLRTSEAASLRLRTELAEVGRHRAEAELRALRAELNPQVLGPALDTVSSLVRTDPSAAERTIAELGDMMRSAIAPAAAQDSVLEDEVAALAAFLSLQRARFGERLGIRLEVAETARDALVPHLMLQMLVGHAIECATAAPGSVNVHVVASRERDQLQIDIIASAPPAPHTDDATLAKVRVRLAERDPDASLESSVDPERGMVTRLVLRWTEDEEEDRTPPDGISETAVRPRRSWLLPLFLVMWFSVLFVVSASVARTSPLRNGAMRPLAGAIGEGLIAALILTAMLYVAIRLARDIRHHPFRAHAIAAAGLGLLNASNKAIFVAVMGDPYMAVSPGRLVGAVIVGALVYSMFAGAAYAVEYARRYRQSETAGLRLRAELSDAARRRAEAQLRALKAELNPHFLGNALAAVSSLVRTDADAAQRVVAQIGETLRSALERADTHEVTLGEEIEGLAPFLAVERARFGDLLEVEWDVDDDARRIRVPHMILQPLVENAVKHGLSRKGGRITVAGRRAGERLELSVHDNGAGIRPGKPKRDRRGGGVGLANARARLEELYGTNASIDLLPAPDVGTIARLSLPWREA